MKKSLVFGLVLSMVALSPAQAAQVSAGKKCAKVNQKVTSDGKRYTCAKSGNKLAWKVIPARPTSTPTPAPSPTAQPTESPTPVPVATPATWKNYSASEVISRATSEINAYLAIKRTPSQKITVLAQEGTDSELKKWISEGATLVAQAFLYPASTRPFYDVVAFDRTWLEETYRKAGFNEAEVRDRLGGFDAGAPAFGGSTTNTWNATTIKRENLLVRDKAGMAQTAGHEFFHSIQERLVGRNPGPRGEEIPNWFWEGPAMFVGIHSAAAIKAIDFVTEGRKASLDRFNMGSPSTKKLLLQDVKANDGVTDPYGIGYAATEYLVAQVGVEKFLNIYAELGKSKNFATAFQDATGFALSDFYDYFERDRQALGFPRG